VIDQHRPLRARGDADAAWASGAAARLGDAMVIKGLLFLMCRGPARASVINTFTDGGGARCAYISRQAIDFLLGSPALDGCSVGDLRSRPVPPPAARVVHPRGGRT
jgi:hypothetical protein